MRSSENHIYCTQYSDLWWELRGTALITGSTMMKALGFDTLKAEKQHVNVFVKKRQQPEFSDEVHKYRKGEQSACHQHISGFNPASSETQMLFIL